MIEKIAAVLVLSAIGYAFWLIALGGGADHEGEDF